MGPKSFLNKHLKETPRVLRFFWPKSDQTQQVNKYVNATPNRLWRHCAFRREFLELNTSYLTNSYIGFTLEMESVTQNTNFGLKMMVKSGLEKFILKSLHAGR